MTEQLRRPSPYVPLSRSFHTGRTGTAIIEEFGLEGLGVWVAMLATAGIGNQGQIVFTHEQDWAAIGLARGVAMHPLSFDLPTFLKFLGRRKQTRTTRQGRVMYVEITQWERWNHARRKEVARQQKARKRAEIEPDTSRTGSRTANGQLPYPEAEAETDKDINPKAFVEGAEERPWDEAPETEPPASELAEPEFLRRDLVKEMPL